jgi:adenylylsulfate kinase
MVIWITGLPGSGKSALSERIKKEYPNFYILRMDELRKIATPTPTYDEKERDILYRALVFIAMTLSRLGYWVIIDATGNLRRWRELARELIPDFKEVYLRCPIDICMKRERLRSIQYEAPKEIYQRAKEGWPVPGVLAPYEEPLNPELILDTDSMTIEEELTKIKELIEGLTKSPK